MSRPATARGHPGRPGRGRHPRRRQIAARAPRGVTAKGVTTAPPRGRDHRRPGREEEPEVWARVDEEPDADILDGTSAARSATTERDGYSPRRGLPRGRRFRVVAEDEGSTGPAPAPRKPPCTPSRTSRADLVTRPGTDGARCRHEEPVPDTAADLGVVDGTVGAVQRRAPLDDARPVALGTEGRTRQLGLGWSFRRLMRPSAPS